MRNVYFGLCFVLLGAACSGAGDGPGKDSDKTGKDSDEIVVPDDVPACIKDIVNELESAPVANPPSWMTEFDYKGTIVYYVPASCCDQFSTVYDTQCKVVCAPDGGITGTGDGKCPDFGAAAKELRTIWKDGRGK